MRKDGYRNGVLTAIALLLGVLVLGQGSGPSQAGAGQIQHAGQTLAPPEGGGLISAAEQRKLILRELQAMRRQVEEMRVLMSRGLSVKVTEMPEIRMPKEDG